MNSLILIAIAILLVGGIAIALYKKKKVKDDNMPAGVEIRNAAGEVILNNTMLTTCYLGESGTFGYTSGELYIPELQGRTLWFRVLGVVNGGKWECPILYQDGDYLKWYYNGTSEGQGSQGRDVRFIYGAY